MKKKYNYPSKNPLLKLKQQMQKNNFSGITIQSYLYHITNFLKFTNKGPREITANDIIFYLEKLNKEKKSSSTINIAHSAFKFYFENTLKRKFFTPQGKIKRQLLEKKSPEIPTNKDVLKIINFSEKNKYKLIFLFLYKTGIKLSEILALKKNNIDLINKYVKIKGRMVKIPDKLFEELKIYIVDLTDNELLFKNNRQKQLSERSIQKYFSQILKKTSLKRVLTPNTLRHLYIFNLIQSGTSAEEIKNILGYRYLDTIKLYFKIAKKTPSIKRKIKTMFHVKHYGQNLKTRN